MNDAYKSFKVQYPAVISRQQTKMQTKNFRELRISAARYIANSPMDLRGSSILPNSAPSHVIPIRQ